MAGIKAAPFQVSKRMLKNVCVQPTHTIHTHRPRYLPSSSNSLSTNHLLSPIHPPTHTHFLQPQGSSFMMNMEDLLVPKLGLLEVYVVAAGMGGLKDHFPRDQPAHVCPHCSFVGSYPRLNQESEVAGVDHTVRAKPHQLSVEVQASAENHALPHLQRHFNAAFLPTSCR